MEESTHNPNSLHTLGLGVGGVSPIRALTALGLPSDDTETAF